MLSHHQSKATAATAAAPSTAITSVDIREVALVLRRAGELAWFHRELSANSSGGQRNAVLRLIERATAAALRQAATNVASSGCPASLASAVRAEWSTCAAALSSAPWHISESDGELELSEELLRNFFALALPAVHRVCKPANLARQSIQSFASTSDRIVACDPERCAARRLFISSKHAAANEPLLAFFKITDVVRCCLVPPPGGDRFAGDHFLDAGVEDDDTAELGESVVKAIAFVKERLRRTRSPASAVSAALAASFSGTMMAAEAAAATGQDEDQQQQKRSPREAEQREDQAGGGDNERRNNEDNQQDNNDAEEEDEEEKLPERRILVHCKIGRHRAPWFCACILASLALDESTVCPCLAQRTRYHKSLAFAAAQIVLEARPFADISHHALEKIENFVRAHVGLGAGIPESSSDSDDDKNNQSPASFGESVADTFAGGGAAASAA